jgi:hypothetical protein
MNGAPSIPPPPPITPYYKFPLSMRCPPCQAVSNCCLIQEASQARIENTELKWRIKLLASPASGRR